jgi:Zn finger protein HypA/HybF involved in hydrogenase expression
MTRHAIVTAAPLDVHCAVCMHEWVLPLSRPLPIDRFITITRGAIADGCPACGAHGRDVICGKAVRH